MEAKLLSELFRLNVWEYASTLNNCATLIMNRYSCIHEIADLRSIPSKKSYPRKSCEMENMYLTTSPQCSQEKVSGWSQSSSLTAAKCKWQKAGLCFHSQQRCSFDPVIVDLYPQDWKFEVETVKKMLWERNISFPEMLVKRRIKDDLVRHHR